jgi:hypothetical protein
MILGILAYGSMVGTAQAVIIIDTGTPSQNSSGLSLNSQSFLAGEFELAQNYRITDVQGYFFDKTFASLTPGSLTLAIYGDEGNIPDIANQLFSQAFTVPNTGSGIGANWYGVSGMAVDLIPGEYWVAFEVRSGNTYNGYMPVTSPNPVPSAFFNLSLFTDYRPNPLINNDPGFRVFATDVPESGPGLLVPEPSTLFFLATGLLGLMGVKRITGLGPVGKSKP